MGNVQMENLIQRSLLYTRGSVSETNTAFDHNGGERAFRILENLIKVKCSKHCILKGYRVWMLNCTMTYSAVSLPELDRMIVARCC